MRRGSERTGQEAQGSRLKLREVHLNIRRNIFILKVVKHWNKLHREVVECPSLEVLQT